jgi:hypothetical protein
MDRRLDQRFERRRQTGLMSHRALAAGTPPAHAPINVVASGLKLVDATIDRAPCKARRKRGCRDTTKSKRQSFIGRKQAPAALVEKRSRQLPARPDFIKVNHGPRLSLGHRAAPTKFAILFLRFRGRC